MSWNMVTIWKNFGVFVHPCPLALVEAMVCLESITARTSLSNWLVIDGSIPPDTLNTAQCKYTQIQKYKIHKYTNTITCLSQIVLSLMAPYHPIQSTLRHTHTFTLRVALILIHTLCIVLHSTLHTVQMYIFHMFYVNCSSLKGCSSHCTCFTKKGMESLFNFADCIWSLHIAQCICSLLTVPYGLPTVQYLHLVMYVVQVLL